MNTIIRTIRSHPWILPLVVGAILIVAGACMHGLWGDEAETALFARNILKYGVPRGWDGTNIMGIDNAVVLNSDLINHTSPWAQYYLTAASFAIFGQNSFTARLPFIIISIFSFYVIWKLVRRITGDGSTATLTVWMCALSVPFILFSYQCRYYALASFSGLVFVYAAYELWVRKAVRARDGIAFILSGTVFFYANYVMFVAFYGSVAITLLMLGPTAKARLKLVTRALILSIPIVALTALWYIIMKPFDTRGTLNIFPWDQMISLLGLCIDSVFHAFNQNNAFPLVFWIALPFVIFFRKWKHLSNQPLLLFFFISVFYLLIMTFFTLIASVDTLFVAVRYTMVIFPYFVAACAIMLVTIVRWNKIVGILCICIYMATNLFTLEAPRSYWIDFAREVTHPYRTPDIVVADYLKAHAKPGDTAFVSLDRDHEPLIFYLRTMIKFINRVTLINTRIFPKNRGIIPRYIYDFRDEPDWVIEYSKRGNDGTFFAMDYRDIPPNIDLVNDYRQHVIPIFFSDLSRPELDLRSFSGVVHPAPTDDIYIYEKKK